MIDGKAPLIEPSQCIGHGGCQDEAVQAIFDEAGSEAAKGETGPSLLLAASAGRESAVALLLRG
jgi:ferredoxin